MLLLLIRHYSFAIIVIIIAFSCTFFSVHPHVHISQFSILLRMSSMAVCVCVCSIIPLTPTSVLVLLRENSSFFFFHSFPLFIFRKIYVWVFHPHWACRKYNQFYFVQSPLTLSLCFAYINIYIYINIFNSFLFSFTTLSIIFLLWNFSSLPPTSHIRPRTPQQRGGDKREEK